MPDLRDALFSPASFRGLPKLSSSRVSLARPRKLTEFCNFSATVRLLVWPNSLVFLKPREKKSSHQTAELPPWLQTGQKKKTFFFGHRNKFLAFHRGTLFRALARSGNAEVGARDPVGVLIWDDRFGVCACELFCSVFRRGITRNLRRTARHKATSKRPTCRVSESPATARKRNFTMVATGLAPVVLTETQIIRKPVTKEYDPHGAYPSSNKQWYTLVRLDEYALCSGGPDDELRELEERILSEPDDTSDDDALETNSGTSVGDETETIDQISSHSRLCFRPSAARAPVGRTARSLTTAARRVRSATLFLAIAKPSPTFRARLFSTHPSVHPGTRPCGGSDQFLPAAIPSIRGARVAQDTTETVADDTHYVSHSPFPNTDSPQWRRGPASKPMLCNACGTRYRRTNTLGPSTPVHRVASAPVLPKKRSPPQSPSGLNPAKKVRCASAEDLAGEHFGRAVGVRA